MSFATEEFENDNLGRPLLIHTIATAIDTYDLELIRVSSNLNNPPISPNHFDYFLSHQGSRTLMVVLVNDVYSPCASSFCSVCI